MECTIKLPQQQTHTSVPMGTNLLEALRSGGYIVDAPCGGRGTCGKCKVTVDGVETLACQTTVDRDMTVELPEKGRDSILTAGISVASAGSGACHIAFDIGTTTIAGFLIDGSGRELCSESCENPQRAYGADVISRIQYALKTDGNIQTKLIRQCLSRMTTAMCQKCGIEEASIQNVSIVGNPAMQQLFLGISPENLAKLPFSPALTEAEEVAAKDYIPGLENAKLLIVPDISGFVGADTIACLLATDLDSREDWTLLVDIGTNGEMVLGNNDRMVASSTAAGPALEGANISCGMRGRPGAIDHVWAMDGQLHCSTIGGLKAEGICGSGLIDVADAALELGLINSRGRVQTEDRCLRLAEGVTLTQDDIRQLQLAKGAIAAGIRLMAEHLEIELEDIQKVFLAGAFGTFMDPASACGIGLLPPELEGRIEAVGNAAGSGAKLLACDPGAKERVLTLLDKTEFLDLASVPDFQYIFAENMIF